LRACLLSIDSQNVLPDETIIVDSSTDFETRDLIAGFVGVLRFPCRYLHTTNASAAQQRNLGADLVKSDLILFLDDDVVLEPGFFSGILAVFRSDASGVVAGVSGTITNQVYSDPKGLNRFLLGLCLGRFRGSFAGRILGPAVNFLPADGAAEVQGVEWLPSTCTAFRRDIFLEYRFERTFQGYSFAEDVHLSTRIARNYRLMNTTRARVFHADLGKDTHKDWAALGESQVKNRHLIMTTVLGKTGLADHIRLFAYEIVYTACTLVVAGLGSESRSRLGGLMRGKMNAFRKIWTATSPGGARS
jgi:glycosyltransferase involved in cell wall biosynthesis